MLFVDPFIFGGIKTIHEVHEASSISLLRHPKFFLINFSLDEPEAERMTAANAKVFGPPASDLVNGNEVAH